FSGFDPINAELIRGEILRLRDEGTTVMLSTHNMGSVEQLCEHIALIDKSHKVLDGAVHDIRRQFSTNTYRVEYTGNRVQLANALSFTGELLDVKEGEPYSTARVKLGPGSNLNDVLKQVVHGVEVHGVQEEIPSMHDVFIRVVSEHDPATVGSDMTE
ncbi:MAG: DUF4162 domain-containing protein, partial [Flavobacteriales bacterium]|nr:DUF4162 domain-containing protein [Flavobacteriales bacterium]